MLQYIQGLLLSDITRYDGDYLVIVLYIVFFASSL